MSAPGRHAGACEHPGPPVLAARRVDAERQRDQRRDRRAARRGRLSRGRARSCAATWAPSTMSASAAPRTSASRGSWRSSLVDLGLPDASFRGYEGDDQLLGEPRDDDDAPVALLRREILRLEPQQLYFPLGIGGHVDHVLCRDVALALLDEPRGWVMPDAGPRRDCSASTRTSRTRGGTTSTATRTCRPPSRPCPRGPRSKRDTRTSRMSSSARLRVSRSTAARCRGCSVIRAGHARRHRRLRAPRGLRGWCRHWQRRALLGGGTTLTSRRSHVAPLVMALVALVAAWVALGPGAAAQGQSPRPAGPPAATPLAEPPSEPSGDGTGSGSTPRSATSSSACSRSRRRWPRRTS